jgi:hypothetical protein
MSQDGNGGFGGMFTRSAQRETVTSNLSTQLQSGCLSIALATIALFIVLAVAVAVGPSSVWLAVQVGIVALAVNRVHAVIFRAECVTLWHFHTK